MMYVYVMSWNRDIILTMDYYAPISVSSFATAISVLQGKKIMKKSNTAVPVFEL